MSGLGKLRPEVKEKWLAALRSDDYRQGREYLHFREGESEFYCCLGVLCDLAKKEGVVSSVELLRSTGDPDADDPATRSGYDIVIEYGGTPCLPPSAVVGWAYEIQPDPNDDDWVVLVAYYPDEPEYTRRLTLAELNDEHGLSFAQIADLIEEQL